MAQEKTHMWQVVGGADKGGIIVRTGRELNSPQTEERLSYGAFVEQKEVFGERLNFVKVTGTGPTTGWVSVKVGSTALVVRTDDEAHMVAKRPEEGVAPAPCSNKLPAIIGRKMRVLALHGCPGNASLMKFQCAPLKALAGNGVEWIYLDGPLPWYPVPGATAAHQAEPSDTVKLIAGKKPFKQWYDHDDPKDLPKSDLSKSDLPESALNFDDVKYLQVEEGCKYLEDQIDANKPIDVILAFSQAGTLVAMLMDAMRKRGCDIPWRQNILFCGAMIDDTDYQLKEAFDFPAVYVVGGDTDDWGAHGKKCLPQMYRNLTILEHDDGHAFPTSAPRAKDIFSCVLQKMYQVCGQTPNQNNQ